MHGKAGEGSQKMQPCAGEGSIGRMTEDGGPDTIRLQFDADSTGSQSVERNHCELTSANGNLLVNLSDGRKWRCYSAS